MINTLVKLESDVQFSMHFMNSHVNVEIFTATLKKSLCDGRNFIVSF